MRKMAIIFFTEDEIQMAINKYDQTAIHLGYTRLSRMSFVQI